MALAISTTLHSTFDDAVENTRKALADQGFGVLTEIDVKATLKAKLGEEIEDYLILGACNPSLAHRAIDVDRQSGCCFRATSWCAPIPPRRTWSSLTRWIRR